MAGKTLYDMTQDEALEYLRGLEGIQNIGKISATGGVNEYDPVYWGSERGGDVRPVDTGEFGVPEGPLFSRNVTPLFDPNYGGGVYGYYEGIYDKDGNLKDVKFRKGERDEGFLSENLETIGPLVVLGAMGAGAGLFGGLGGGAGASTGAGLAGEMGGTVMATEGGLSALDAAAAYDAALTGVGSNVGSGLLTEGAMGATAGAGAAAGGAGAAGAGAAGAGGAGAAGAGAAGAGAGVLGTGLTAGQAAGLLGAVVGAATSGNKTATTNTQREPWGPAQDWIKQNIQTGQALQRDYQANPFSSLQKNAYQNVFSGIDGFANGILPSVFGAVNSFRPYSRTGAPSTPTFNFQAPQRTNYGTLNWQDLIRMPQQPMTAGVQNNTPQGLL